MPRTGTSASLILTTRSSGQSTANTELTVSTSTGKKRRLLYITVKYSTNVTQNVTVTLNSGAGSEFDTLIQTIELSTAKDGFFMPDKEIILSSDDTCDVVAPAGGGVTTSAVAIYTEVL